MDKGSSISDFFSDLTEPRDSNKRHKLIDIITIALCAVICGADTWEDIEEFGDTKKEWFERFLELPHGIPGHDTFARVFASMNPKEFQQAFLRWVEAVQIVTKRIVAIDGKTLRRSHEKNKSPLHLVSVWALENKMVLGQVKTREKSNEITAIPELLSVLELGGCIVTIDAMGCQKEIVRTIIGKGADYVLGLKGNQGTLHDDVKLYFEDCLASGFRDIEYDYHETIDGDHGRIERRRYWTTSDIDWLPDRALWKNLSSIVMVQRERYVNGTTSMGELLCDKPQKRCRTCCSGSTGPLGHREQPSLGARHRIPGRRITDTEGQRPCQFRHHTTYGAQPLEKRNLPQKEHQDKEAQGRMGYGLPYQDT